MGKVRQEHSPAVPKPMITEKTSLGKDDFPAIVTGAVIAYLVTASFLHSGSPEILDFAAKTCFLLILVHFLKKVGVTMDVLQTYDLKRFRVDFLKAGKYFALVSLGVALIILLLAGMLELGCYLIPALSGFCENAAKARNIVQAQGLPPAFSSPLRTLFYLSTLCFVAPVAEEIFFRRFVFVSLRKRCDKVCAITWSAVIFGVVHFEGFIVAAVMGAFLAYVYEKEERLVIPILIHVLKNITAVFAGLAYYYIR